jgi:hypothetical protein
MNYQIKIDLEASSGALGVPFTVEVYSLMNNWDVQRSFALAKKTWQEAHADEMQSKATSARWMDFRVRDGVNGAAILQPVRYNQDTLAAIVTDDGEHAESSVDVAGTEKFFTWATPSGTELSVLDEWQHYGRAESDPASSATNAPYDGVNSDDFSNIEQTNIGDDGNNPPYSSFSAGDYLVKVATLRYQPGADGLQRLSTGYFDAPCGLFVLKHNLPGANLSNGTISMVAKSGDYKGVDAKSMCQ